MIVMIFLSLVTLSCSVKEKEMLADWNSYIEDPRVFATAMALNLIASLLGGEVVLGENLNLGFGGMFEPCLSG